VDPLVHLYFHREDSKNAKKVSELFLDRLLVIGCELLLVHPRQEQGIVVDDGVCDEP
jgi:hypothetical protein